MMGVAYDGRAAMLVAIRDRFLEPTEYADFLQWMRRLDDDGAKPNTVPICILVTLPGTPAPDADWRKRYAEHARTAKCRNLFMALVTESPIQRGIITAIRWLSGIETNARPFETLAAALKQAETVRPGAGLRLSVLHDEADRARLNGRDSRIAS